jgi:DNA modification methylase/superfamily II DNA or RNA helicase
MEYQEFLKTKQKSIVQSGFEIKESELNPLLFPFQKFIVKRALKAGKYAVFADCGLGKTFMQLEWANQIVKKTKKPVLILCPLAVSGQTIDQGNTFGIPVEKIKSDIFGPGIYISNYEQIENIDCSVFSGIVLDESSILKNYTGVYKNLIINSFAATKYKLACTATPAPNDLNEIGNHAEFLDVMDANDMRMRWFVRDEGMNNYRLKGHADSDFYGWISSWSSVLRSPADLGFDGSNYILPKLNYFESQIKTDKKENGKIFNDSSVNATEFNRELRITIAPRIEAVAQIVNLSTEPFIIWINQNEEEKKVLELIPDAVAVRGSDNPKLKESRLLGFAKGEFRVLVTKKKIAQFGLNYQHCRNQIFAALDFSFEGLYQAIRRSYRFGQKEEVNIYLISTDTMENVAKTIEFKQKQFNKMMEEISKAVNGQSFGLSIDYSGKRVKNDWFNIANADSCEDIQTIESNSMDFSVFSPPFSTLFTYSDNIRDLGNCANDAEFFEQNAFILKELYRIMKPGRLVCVHSKDLARYKNSSGYSGMWDFTGDYHRAMEKAGFKYHSKITIWIDPVLEMQRTKTQRLLHKQVTSDASYSGIGMPEYITVFRKWEGDENDWEPVINKTKANFPIPTWQEWASPVYKPNLLDLEKSDLISQLLELKAENFRLKFQCNPDLPLDWYSDSWMDINRTDVLNNYKGARNEKDEKHIAPLQLDIIERCIAMWSNPGETVYTPFLGIGSEVFKAVKMGRKGRGSELKESYFDLAVRNCNAAVLEKSQLQLAF